MKPDQRNFVVDVRKLEDAVLALEDFLKSVMNEDGTPVPIPSYVNRSYLTELVASMTTKLRYYGQLQEKFANVELETHKLVSEEGSPFRKVN